MQQALGRLRPERYTELQERLAQLKAEFGEGLVKAEVNRRSKPKRVGRPHVRNYIRLFVLWIVVEASAKLKKAKIDQTCQFIEKMGGVFEYGGYNVRSYDPSNYQAFFHAFAVKGSTIRRLYYEACKKFDEYEQQFKYRFRPGLKLPLLRERLLVHAGQLAGDETNFLMPQFLSIRSLLYVHCHLYLDGTLVLPDFPGFEPLPRTVVLQDDQELSTRIRSLFHSIFGDDGRGAAALLGAPRPTADDRG